MRKFIKKYKRLISINIFVFFLAFGSIEICVRLLTNSNSTLNINIGGFKEYHDIRGAKLKANYTSKNIKTNSFSILGPEFEILKEKNKIRVLSIGNSVTFSPVERNYSLVMQEKLSNQFDSDIEVICAAVPGYDSFDALNWYDEFLHKIEVDIAVIYLGFNDLGQFHPFGVKYKIEKLGYSDRSFSGFLMKHIYTLRIPYFFAGRIQRNKEVDLSELTIKEFEIVNNYFPDHYFKNMTSLVEKLKNDGVSVYLVDLTGLLNYDNITDKEIQKIIFPRGTKRKLSLFKALFEKYQHALDSVSQTTVTPLIDLPSLISTTKDRMIFTDDCHINISGSEIFGSFISDAISEEIHQIQKFNNKKHILWK